jgi:hypothetical protein
MGKAGTRIANRGHLATRREPLAKHLLAVDLAQHFSRATRHLLRQPGTEMASIGRSTDTAGQSLARNPLGSKHFDPESDTPRQWADTAGSG